MAGLMDNISAAIQAEPGVAGAVLGAPTGYLLSHYMQDPARRNVFKSLLGALAGAGAGYAGGTALKKEDKISDVPLNTVDAKKLSAKASDDSFIEKLTALAQPQTMKEASNFVKQEMGVPQSVADRIVYLSAGKDAGASKHAIWYFADKLKDTKELSASELQLLTQEAKQEGANWRKALDDRPGSSKATKIADAVAGGVGAGGVLGAKYVAHSPKGDLVAKLDQLAAGNPTKMEKLKSAIANVHRPSFMGGKAVPPRDLNAADASRAAEKAVRLYLKSDKATVLKGDSPALRSALSRKEDLLRAYVSKATLPAQDKAALLNTIDNLKATEFQNVPTFSELERLRKAVKDVPTGAVADLERARDAVELERLAGTAVGGKKLAPLSNLRSRYGSIPLSMMAASLLYGAGRLGVSLNAGATASDPYRPLVED